MNFTSGLSKQGKHYLNTTTDDKDTVKSNLSKEEFVKFEKNIKKEGIEAEKQKNTIFIKTKIGIRI